MATEAPPVTILPVQPFTMHCANRHQWTEHWPVPCRLDAWAARGLAAMTGILAGTGLGIARSRLPRPDQVADMAVDYADALIAALKEAPDGTE